MPGRGVSDPYANTPIIALACLERKCDKSGANGKWKNVGGLVPLFRLARHVSRVAHRAAKTRHKMAS
jgi:hypothetical protein